MNILKFLGLFLLAAFLVPMSWATAEANGDPGLIVGQVKFTGFTTTSISTTAVGGGSTAQKTTHDSSSYQLPVAGGGWNYTVSSSCGLSGGNNNSVTVSFNQRNFPVASGATVTNDYIFNSGTVRFQVNITGDQPISAASTGSWATKAVPAGEKTASYSTGTPFTTATSFYWDLPVVPNQQIELTAKIIVNGPSGAKQYVFSKAADSPYLLAPIDVASGELVVVPLEIQFVDGDPSPTLNLAKGYLAGKVDLLGLPSGNFARHLFIGKNFYVNPANYSLEYSFNENQYATPSLVTPTTFFDSSIDSSLRWPYINGDQNNNKATVYPDTTTYLDFERAGGFLAGRINLSGAIQNEDLHQITFSFTGVGNVYDADTKKWSYLENNYGAATVQRHATSSSYKRPSVRDYKLFLTTGDWEIPTVTLTRQLSSPTRTSSVTFIDHTTRYNGQTYFGTPIHIEQGVKEKDFDYCFGSIVIRFTDPLGRLLRNPTVSGNGTHRTNGVIDLSISGVSANSAVNGVEEAEVELFGPPGDYKLSTIRVTASDGTTLTTITHPARDVSLACNSRNILYFPGPTLTILNPQREMITNAQLLPVTGRAYGGSAIASITVNGYSAALTPVAGGKANEVEFRYDLPLTAGENTVTVTVNETSGALATDQMVVFADLWQPTVAIVTPADGQIYYGAHSDVSINIEAADIGYGYTLNVLLDGSVLYSAEGAGNTSAPDYLAYDTIARALGLGDHVITATVSDRAGNIVSSSSTVSIQEAPPLIFGLADQLLEATSAAGAMAFFDVSAESRCVDEPAPVLPAPALIPQGNSTIPAGSTIGKTFVWGAVSSPYGDPVQYQVQISNSLDFATVTYSSAWQSGTTWTQTLPIGTWFWRVTARDSVTTSLQSLPATGNSFSILSDGQMTAKFNILHDTTCTLSGGVYPDAGELIWVGAMNGEDVDRSFLMFDTSALGAGATIASAKLYLDYRNRDHLDMESVTTVHESTWEFPGDSTTYYNLGASLASQLIKTDRPFGAVPFSVRADYIRNTGVTKFALAAADEDYDWLWNSAPGFAKANSYLEVTYTPATPLWAAPTLNPQENATSQGENILTTFQWSEVTAADGDPVQYRLEISSTADFFSISASSPWQTDTTWTQSLPVGKWYWRVTARDAIHTERLSLAAASSFSVLFQSAPTPPGEAAVTCSMNSGDIFPLGVTTVTCVAQDACNRSAAGSFTITIQDTAAPVLTVPADLTVEANSAQGATVVFDVSATDLIDPAPAVNCTPASGSNFPVGASLVGCIAWDASGNAAIESFTVTVVATTPPVLTVPVDVTVEATGPLTPVEIGQASATHNLSFTLGNDAPAAFPLGTTVVTWTAIDGNGNAASATQNVTVTDLSPPVLAGLAGQVLEATSSAGVEAVFNITAADLVDPAPEVSCSAVSGALFPLGETVVTCSADDANGNSASGSFTITVRDTTAPVLTTPEDITVVLNTSVSSPLIQNFLNGATAIDTVDASVTVSATAVATLDTVGTRQVTYAAVDASGNQSVATATIHVVYGGGETFLPPVGLDKPFKKGSTIPIKIEFSDANGAAVTSAIVRLFLYLVSNDVPSEDPIEFVEPGIEDTGNLFKVADGHYQYNLTTKNLAVGTYQARAALDDGTIRTVLLALKQ